MVREADGNVVDLVLEGGGMRGIAHVGALEVAEARGYRWRHCAGTSAGALIAALLASGYTAVELRALLAEVNFARFGRDVGWRGWGIAQLGRLLINGGLHTGDYLEEFLRAHLRARGKRLFGDLLSEDYSQAAPNSPYRYRLSVMASDVTNGRLLRLPQDLALYGQSPDELDIALAVRMSASIPFFYRPIVCRDQVRRPYRIVDGGLLSNFPLEVFEIADIPACPTLGLRLIDIPAPRIQEQENLLQFAQELLSTMLTARDRFYLDEHRTIHTIAIPVDGISGTCFALNRVQIEQLYSNGAQAAERFFAQAFSTTASVSSNIVPQQL